MDSLIQVCLECCLQLLLVADVAEGCGASPAGGSLSGEACRRGTGLSVNAACSPVTGPGTPGLPGTVTGKGCCERPGVS